MDYLSVFDISGSGMDLQRARLETMAANLANVNSSSKDASAVYRPLEVVGKSEAMRFDALLNELPADNMTVDYDVIETTVEARLVYEPTHPHANLEGFVAYPDINPVTEMVKLMTATRAYEANAQAINAAKSMMAAAMEIGKG
jgi:flagellar basal-body rod protein FlgC